MKIKLLCLLLTLGLLLTGCGRKDNNTNSKPNTSGGNTSSGIMGDISDGASDLKDDIKDEASDLKDDMKDDKDHSDGGRGDRDEDNIIGNGDNENTPTVPDKDPIPPAVDPDANTTTSEDVPTGASLSEADLMKLDNTKLGWGQGVNVDEFNRPYGSLDYQKKYGQYDAYFIGEDEKVIYLTFDEGWENGYTGVILDVLQQKQVPAVFFCTLDYIEKWPDLISRMVTEGHAVGNHSDNHPCFPELSVEDCRKEVMNVHDYMVEHYDYDMTLFRAPAGEFSERTLAELQMLGYKTMFWSFAYKDWEVDNQMETAKAYDKVTGALHNGAIYLLHAVSSTNAEILGDFIDEARAQGYEFKLLQ